MHRSYSALGTLLLFVAPAWSQDKPPAPMLNAPASAVAQPATPQTAVAQPGAGSTTAKLDAAELEQLLGPIALYPDELLANVLAASVYPDEVAEAAKLVSMGADKSVIDSRTWEPPVKAIAKIPDVITMLGEFPEWTTALGQAYLTQAQDVMAAVQSLRKKAQGTGALQTTEQQKVIVEKETVYIESSDPQVVYVPSYQPSVVYVDDDDDDVIAAGLIGFGTGIVVGAVWADLACDWNHGCIGWGNDVNVDINRGDINIDQGDVNIGSGNIGSGNQVNHRARAGQEGGAWSPNSSKQLATSKPAQTQNFARGGADASTRPAAPRASTGGAGSRASGAARTTASAGSRPSAATRTQAPASARQPAAGSRPSMPTAERANRASAASGYQGSGTRSASSSSNRSNSAFQGGANSRADSSRGAMSRQSSSRSQQASRPSPSRSSGARSGGGGRGGGGRGGRR